MQAWAWARSRTRAGRDAGNGDGLWGAAAGGISRGVFKEFEEKVGRQRHEGILLAGVSARSGD